MILLCLRCQMAFCVCKKRSKSVATEKAARRQAAKAQMECIGDIICDDNSRKAAAVARAGARKALEAWVETGRMRR